MTYKYYIWTIGCQMNKAESSQIGDIIEQAGYTKTNVIKDADLIIANSCVVRQNAEDKVFGFLSYLKGQRKYKPNLEIAVTGCFVDSNHILLKENYPYVDLFFIPGDYDKLQNWLAQQNDNITSNNTINSDNNGCSKYTALIPIIQGCNNFCSYCIVPYRRGREKSRNFGDILAEVEKLVNNGTREITLLGQNVNSYGKDLESKSDLSQLLIMLCNIEKLARIRFLTNHPRDMSIKLIETMSRYDKICKHLNIPIQSGNDQILDKMNRGYTIKYYIELIKQIRKYMPSISLSTDIIVGFPGEDENQFGDTIALLQDIKFDTVHVAMYSVRNDTLAAHKYTDDVTTEIKRKRLFMVEELQSMIAGKTNELLIGKTMSVLAEGRKYSKWYGRTETNKLVFFESEHNLMGKLVNTKIYKTSPWSLQAKIVR
jgi:tRNA-2-methylthio-N6-dimethylallyladenosine synthase